MKLQQKLQQIWYKGSKWVYLLLPLHFLMLPLVKLRFYAYRHNYLSAVKLKVPVVVVGNISLGGTGKTPFVIWLYQQLAGKNIKVGIVSRGYRGKLSAGGCLVNATSSAYDIGDEPMLIYNRTQAPMAIGADRVKAAQRLVAQYPDLELILADDGMQHYRLARSLEIAIVDGTLGFGNCKLFPAGPLREPVSRLQQVDFIVANSAALANASTMQLVAKYIYPTGGNRAKKMSLAELRGKTVHAVAGIGNPQRFFDLLEKNQINVIAHPFPDHYQPQEDDFNFNDDKIILLTEKDAVKCRNFKSNKLWYLPVDAKLPANFAATLSSSIQKLIHQYAAQNKSKP